MIDEVQFKFISFKIFFMFGKKIIDAERECRLFVMNWRCYEMASIYLMSNQRIVFS